MNRLVLSLLLVAVLALVWWALFAEEPDGSSALSEDSLLDGVESGGAPGLTSGGEAPLVNQGAPDRVQPPLLAPPGWRSSRPLRLQGRVLDEGRHPVAGVRVGLEIMGGVSAQTETAADGRYQFELPAPPPGPTLRGLIRGKQGTQRMGVVQVWLPSSGGDVKVDPLVLGAAARLSLRVLHEGAAVPGASVALLQRVGGMPSVVAERKAGRDGRLLIEGLPTGAVEVLAAGAGYGRAHLRTSLPRPAGEELSLSLTRERTLDVRVVDGGTGRPVAGAEVMVGDQITMPPPHGPGYLPGRPLVTTDRGGRVSLGGLGEKETIYINARATGYALSPWWRARTQVAKPGQADVEVRLFRLRRIVFPVAAGDEAAPPDGTPLTVETLGARGQGGAIRASLEDGYLVLADVPNQNLSGVVITPAGAQAVFTAPAGVSEGAMVSFGSAREVRVRVVEPDGTPVPELRLGLRPVGRAAKVAPATTDERGEATFQAVGSTQASIHLLRADRPAGGALLGKLDLTDGQAIYELELQSRLSFILRLHVEGEPRLPPRYRILVGGQRLSQDQIEEDPSAGEIRAYVRPPAGDVPIPVALHATGFLPVKGQLDPRGSGAEELRFDLVSAGVLLARVRPPEDGHYSLGLMRLATDGKSWGRVTPPSAGPGAVSPRGGAVAEDGLHRFEGLTAGTYRVEDGRTRVPSASVEVVLGAAAAQVELDLSRSIWVEGRVLAPPGTKFAQVRVIVIGRDDPNNLWGGRRTDVSGVFRLRALKGERLSLTVAHPTLSPAARGGRVELEAGRGRVELRLEASSEARFRIVGLEEAQTPQSGVWYPPLQVHFFRGAIDGAPLQSIAPVAEAGLFRIGGFKPGTYTLFLAYGKTFAPTILQGVELGAGQSDLGTITPSEGERLRFKLRTRAGKAAPHVWATVTYEGLPRYARHAGVEKESGDLVCGGLGAGRFQVVVRGANLAPGSTMTSVLYEKRHTFDGRGETVIDIEVP